MSHRVPRIPGLEQIDVIDGRGSTQRALMTYYHSGLGFPGTAPARPDQRSAPSGCSRNVSKYTKLGLMVEVLKQKCAICLKTNEWLIFHNFLIFVLHIFDD